jgi:hypothetical protein
VIVATGGTPDGLEDEVPGAELGETLWEVLEGGGAMDGEILCSMTGSARRARSTPAARRSSAAPA